MTSSALTTVMTTFRSPRDAPSAPTRKVRVQRQQYSYKSTHSRASFDHCDQALKLKTEESKPKSY